MRWFYDNPATVERFAKELDTWRGTPFLDQHAIKGVGADCVRWVEAVNVNMGACPPIQFPVYATFGDAAILAQLTDMLRRVPNLQQVYGNASAPGTTPETSVLIAGDILCFSTGKALHHLAMIGPKPPELWHSIKAGGSMKDGKFVASGVQRGSFDDPVCKGNLRSIYRFYVVDS